jgi:hypothetical protein
MRYLVLLIISLPFISTAAPPDYASYSVVTNSIKKFAPTQIPKSGIDWKVGRCLRYSDDDPLNFAGKYTLEEVGCGTGCIEYCLIDRTTGLVYPGKDFTQDFPNDYRGRTGLHYRCDSRLLIVYDAISYEYPIQVSYYVWDGAKMKLLETDEIRASK